MIINASRVKKQSKEYCRFLLVKKEMGGSTPLALMLLFIDKSSVNIVQSAGDPPKRRMAGARPRINDCSFLDLPNQYIEITH